MVRRRQRRVSATSRQRFNVSNLSLSGYRYPDECISLRAHADERSLLLASFASRALARTNAYRSQFNCPPLRENAQLDQAAFAHSQDMALHGYFDHNSPSGQTPWDRMHAAGYQFSLAAENIAAGYPTPEAVIDAFFHETPPNDGHRRNLLNCALRDVGFAYYYQKGSAYGSYWTQDFATPL